jgi:hypothetical protein
MRLLEQAMDGKIVEAEDQAGEADEKSLGCKTEWDNMDLDWKGRRKEWSQKLEKTKRALAALQEARPVILVSLLSLPPSLLPSLPPSLPPWAPLRPRVRLRQDTACARRLADAVSCRCCIL